MSGEGGSEQARERAGEEAEAALRRDAETRDADAEARAVQEAQARREAESEVARLLAELQRLRSETE